MFKKKENTVKHEQYISDI